MKGKPCEDHCILQHSNRLCVVTLADTHPILQNGRTIKSINYQISNGCSRLNNKVSGKSKRGGQFLTDFAPLCRITCTDETEYTIYSCIRGRLLEVNENILERPTLLLEKPSTEGYIAVILPKFEESKSITENLLSREEFESVVSKRTAAQSQPSWLSSTSSPKVKTVLRGLLFLQFPPVWGKTEDIFLEGNISLLITSKRLLHIMQALRCASRWLFIVSHSFRNRGGRF